MLHKAIDIMSLDSIVCILWMTVSKAVGVIVGVNAAVMIFTYP